MLSLQEDMRALVNHDLDCSEPSSPVDGDAGEMVDLIRQRNAMGGMEVCPNIAERLKQNHRMAAPSRVRQGKARPKPGSSPERDRPRTGARSSSGFLIEP